MKNVKKKKNHILDSLVSKLRVQIRAKFSTGVGKCLIIRLIILSFLVFVTLVINTHLKTFQFSPTLLAEVTWR